MKNFFSGLGTGLCVVLSLCAFPFGAHASMSKEDVHQIVEEFILENPNVLIKSLNDHQIAEQRRQEEEAIQNLAKHRDFLTGSDIPAAGPEDADVHVVEVFDYNCGWCKRALPDILGLLEDGKGVRVHFIEYPVLGPPSRMAARWALAAHKQGRYFDFHVALMEHKGQMSEELFSEVATTIGLDLEQLEKDLSDPSIDAALAKNMAIMRDIGISGTPAFIIGDEVLRGYVGPEAMADIVNGQREKGKTP